MMSERPAASMGKAVRRSMAVAYGAEPRLLIAAFLLNAIPGVPLALAAYWLKLLADGVITRDGPEVLVACGLLAASAAGSWLLQAAAVRTGNLLRLRATTTIHAHVARLQTAVVGIEHQENPELLDRLNLLREQPFLLDHMYGALMGVVGLAVTLLVTVGLLASISPLLLLLVVFAVPAALVASRRSRREARAADRAAPRLRLARHLFEAGLSSDSAKELRLIGFGPPLFGLRREARARGVRTMNRAAWASAAWYTAAWTLFGLAYVVALGVVAIPLHGSPGSVLLVIAAGGGIARYLGEAVSVAQFLTWTLDACGRLAWLEDYAALRHSDVPQRTPARLTSGIRFESVDFRYPGTEREVLRDVNLTVPAGSVVAIVGENGAGKSTLVKLLCRFYEPTHGRILVDGVDLAEFDPEKWRERVAGAFQDFMRFEFPVRTVIGLGDLPRAANTPVLETAVARAGAGDVVQRLPKGLDTQLGPSWEEGVDLSFGQWQKTAVARGLMRDHPLLVVLDEPTAALDAETEHGLFEHFASQARAANREGRITILVSHRFSTVRMADVIVVLDGARVVETGSHEELMREGGVYADLYGIQARAYR